uniref:Fanconi-associated nuclease n=1 Tax=Meloidogyne hapla TaxID=6305 RepID=A0A1I8B1C2_MELHA
MDVGAVAIRPHQCYVDLCDQLIYIKAKYDEQRLVCLIDKSLFEEAKSFATELKEAFSMEFLGGDDAKISEFINLPFYLRKFTPPWIYCRCIFRGVEAAQRLKDYELAVNWLIFLLEKEEFKHFCVNSRGRWYKRLVLNLNKHLKRDEEAAKFCCRGIADPLVLISDKLSLQQRLEKLSKRVDCPQDFLENRLVLDEPEKVFITGLTLGKGLGDGLQVNHFYIPSTSNQPNENVQPGNVQSDTLSSSSDTSCSSSSFTSRRKTPTPSEPLSTQTTATIPSTASTTTQSNNKDINKCNVEEIALRHFIENESYKEGVHAEGRIWHMLFRLFFWDIISCVEFENQKTNDVWISWMQVDPLDLNYTEFYENRRHLIDVRLQKILNASSECILYKSSTSFEERPSSSSSGSPQRKSPRKSLFCSCFIHSTVEKNYNEKYSKTMGNSARNSTVEWLDFEGGKDQLLRFLHCCSPILLHALFKKLCTNFRQSRSGFPDLTVWNAEESKLAVVEVKGPNDQLSTKQQIWLDFFKTQGVRAVVCHVSGGQSPPKFIAKNDRSLE